MDKDLGGNMLLIDKKLAKLEDDTKCVSLSKFTELVKKPSNLTRIGKEKSYCLISHSLACFVEPVRQPRFCFAKSLMGLTDNLAIGRAKLREREIAVGFFR